jgi:hypothetical protein
LGDDHFKVREDGQNLNEEQVDAFHRTVYQLLFAANQVRCDIQMAVSLLTTCVQEPDKDDWGKLKCILKYLNGTQYLKLTLSTDQLKFIAHWYIDGSHQIQKDCRGQTGSLVTFRNGAIASSFNDMKCNTKNSTETEQVSVLSRSLVLRNTVLEEVYKGRSRLSKCDGKLIMDLIWFKVRKQLKRERVCIP